MRKYLACVLLGMLLPLPAECVDAFNLNQLIQLQKSGKSALAYSYALQYQREQEGDSEFDFYFGLAAIDSGFPSEGVFALERVLIQKPDHHLARLELARGYFLLEEYERSRGEFESIMDLDPPKGVRQNIERYLSAIKREQGRYKLAFSAYLELGNGTDDNVNSGPDVIDIFIPFFGIRGDLAANSMQQDDSYNEFKAGLSLDKPISLGWSWFTAFDIALRQHQEFEVFDTGLLEGRLGLSRFYKNSQFRFNLETQKFSVDSEDYRSLIGVNFDWRYRMGTQSQLQTFVQQAQLEYAAQPGRDSDVTTVGVGYVKEFSARLAPLLFANLYFGDETPDRGGRTAMSSVARDFQGVSLGMQLNLPAGLALTTSYSMQNSRYGAEDLFFETVREDDYSLLSLALNWNINQEWSLRALYSSASNRSNIVLNDYNRNQFGLNIRYLFDL